MCKVWSVNMWKFWTKLWAYEHVTGCYFTALKMVTKESTQKILKKWLRRRDEGIKIFILFHLWDLEGGQSPVLVANIKPKILISSLLCLELEMDGMFFKERVRVGTPTISLRWNINDFTLLLDLSIFTILILESTMFILYFLW